GDRVGTAAALLTVHPRRGARPRAAVAGAAGNAPAWVGASRPPETAVDDRLSRRAPVVPVGNCARPLDDRWTLLLFDGNDTPAAAALLRKPQRDEVSVVAVEESASQVTSGRDRRLRGRRSHAQWRERSELGPGCG